MFQTAHWMQWVIVGLFGAYIGGQMVVAASGDSDSDFHYKEFAGLPVQEKGRIKPFDTVARSRLILIQGNSDVQELNENGKVVKSWTPEQWLLDVLSTTVRADGQDRPALHQKIFRIENKDVLGLLHLDPRPSWRYSWKEIFPQRKSFDEEVKYIDENVEVKHRSLYQVKVMELASHLHMLEQLMFMSAPGTLPGREDKWESIAEAERFAQMGAPMHPQAREFLMILNYYADGDVQKFNAALKDYRVRFEKELPAATNTAQLEAYFNYLAPFQRAGFLYAFIFVLACVSWLGWFSVLNRAAFWSMMLVFVVHSWALLMRMYIQERPPVTNLYSSAVFIGWGCVAATLIMECFFRNSIALVAGSATGGLSLLIAHYLSIDSGDTMIMMQAVLDTNFWLWTHVICVALGYMATFVAGFIGIAFVGAMVSTTLLAKLAHWHVGVRAFLQSPESKLGARGFFTRFFDTAASAEMGRMLYGIVCFGMLLSFTGTVLGGLWADVSWGRFWGWDPKENGALLIVIWCALILHARWGGMVKQRGIAVLAVLGNIVTSWSWFGTNFLGVGLHSYGFMEGAMFWLVAFDVAMLVIAGIGLLPLAAWAKLPPSDPVLVEDGPRRRTPSGRVPQPV
jgi:ABC-type transport system involved in cytochrome c biogenesis permease subunit